MPRHDLLRQVLTSERRRLDRDQQVHPDDAPRHRERVPRRHHRHEHVGEPEVDEVVGDDRDDVHGDEDERQRAQVAVGREHPRRRRSAAERAERVEQSPRAGRDDESPRDEPAGAGGVPPEVRRHSAPAGAGLRLRLELAGAGAGVVTDAAIVVGERASRRSRTTECRAEAVGCRRRRRGRADGLARFGGVVACGHEPAEPAGHRDAHPGRDHRPCTLSFLPRHARHCRARQVRTG